MELPPGCTPQSNIELMPKKEILEFKSVPRLEQVGDNRPKQMEHRNHGIDDELILPHRANRTDGIFGNDSRQWIKSGPKVRASTRRWHEAASASGFDRVVPLPTR